MLSRTVTFMTVVNVAMKGPYLHELSCYVTDPPGVKGACGQCSE